MKAQGSYEWSATRINGPSLSQWPQLNAKAANCLIMLASHSISLHLNPGEVKDRSPPLSEAHHSIAFQSTRKTSPLFSFCLASSLRPQGTSADPLPRLMQTDSKMPGYNELDEFRYQLKLRKALKTSWIFTPYFCLFLRKLLQ